MENCTKCQRCWFLLLSPYDSMIDDGYLQQLPVAQIHEKKNKYVQKFEPITVWVLQQNIHFLQPSRLPPRRPTSLRDPAAVDRPLHSRAAQLAEQSAAGPITQLNGPASASQPSRQSITH